MSVLWAGGEDSDFVNIGAGTVSTVTTDFRNTYSRCGLRTRALSLNNAFWEIVAGAFSSASFWFTARVANLLTGAAAATAGSHFIQFVDAAGIVRLRFRNTATTISSAIGPWAIEKVNAAGTATQLGSNTNFTGFLAANATAPAVQKLDIQCVYAVAGSLNIYIDGASVFSYTGDLTTDANTTINGVNLGAWTSSGASSVPITAWSEVIVADTDTRSWSLQTFAPVANGNTHNFDVGSPAAANVNEITLNDSTLDGATSAGLIDEYTCPAVASGTFAVQAFGVSARMQKGSSGPSKADLAVRTGGSDFFSADQSLTLTWAGYQNWWQTNPNTGIAWATTEIGAAVGFNIGIKSVT